MSLHASRRRGSVEALKYEGQMLACDSDALVFETSPYGSIFLGQRHANLGAFRGVLDRIIEKYQKQLMEESFVPGVGNFLIQLAENGNILGARTRRHQGASLFQNLVYVERL